MKTIGTNAPLQPTLAKRQKRFMTNTFGLKPLRFRPKCGQAMLHSCAFIFEIAEIANVDKVLIEKIFLLDQKFKFEHLLNVLNLVKTSTLERGYNSTHPLIHFHILTWYVVERTCIIAKRTSANRLDSSYRLSKIGVDTP